MTTELPRWFTSSYSSTNAECVEVATNLAESRNSVPVRDSKRPTGPTLTLTPAAFTTFVAGVKGDGFGTN